MAEENEKKILRNLALLEINFPLCCLIWAKQVSLIIIIYREIR